MNLETILSPQELPALTRRDLRNTVCVVFDILRATSTFVTALHHGAKAIIPVSEIPEAVSQRRTNPDFLLAGERNGLHIRAAQSGGVDFDFGNSPREFTPDKVSGKTIVSTTTNGTRALRACPGAKRILAASFLNLAATAEYLRGENEILLICAGTGDEMADEDVLAAGAVIELLTARMEARPTMTSASQFALDEFLAAKSDLLAAMSQAKNGQRLLANPELREDVAFCAQRDLFPLVAALAPAGALRRV